MLKVHANNLDTVSVLYVQGQVTYGETEILRNAVRSLPVKSAVILDLGRVTIVDAHGLGVLLELRQQSLAKETRFRLMNVGRNVSRILEIARLDTVFEVTSGLEMFPAFSLPYRAPVAA